MQGLRVPHRQHSGPCSWAPGPVPLITAVLPSESNGGQRCPPSVVKKKEEAKDCCQPVHSMATRRSLDLQLRTQQGQRGGGPWAGPLAPPTHVVLSAAGCCERRTKEYLLTPWHSAPAPLHHSPHRLTLSCVQQVIRSPENPVRSGSHPLETNTQLAAVETGRGSGAGEGGQGLTLSLHLSLLLAVSL